MYILCNVAGNYTHILFVTIRDVIVYNFGNDGQCIMLYLCGYSVAYFLVKSFMATIKVYQSGFRSLVILVYFAFSYLLPVEQRLLQKL